jgi:sirohydrochlorin cobaltochelatase
MKINRAATFIAALLGLSLLVGCSSGNSASGSAETPDPTKAILVVSFGTSYDDNRELSIGGVEKAIAQANPTYQIRRAFTAQTIIDKLAKRDIQIDNVEQAMDRLVADGVKEVIVQPTTLMNGTEYSDAVNEVTPYTSKFDSFAIGAPLLTTDADFNSVATIMADHLKSKTGDDTAIVLMGHGTHATANVVYPKLQGVFTGQGKKDFFVGTVEAKPDLEDVMEGVAAIGAKKVVLAPLMVVAGDHASNDMAGDEEDSWKTKFTAAGYEVETVLEGMGQIPAIQKLYVEHTAQALKNAADGKTGPIAPVEPAASEEVAGPTDQIANAPKSNVAPGKYTVAATLSGGSGRASVASPTNLDVAADGSMTAVVAWSSKNYTWLELDGVRYEPDPAAEVSTFTVPVALDYDIAVSAETVAMGSPKVIEYTLRFDSASVAAR